MITLKRFGSALLVGLACGVGVAQEEATPRGLTLFALTKPSTGAWRLVTLGPAFTASLYRRPDLSWARLGVSGLRMESTQAEGMLALGERAGLKDTPTQWLLLDPAGQLQASGVGQPSLLEVEGALRKRLGALPWDALEGLLRERPDHGEACLARAEFTLVLAGRSYFGDPRPRTMNYTVLLPQAQDALEKLLAVPGWPWQVELSLNPFPRNRLGGAPEVTLTERRQELGGSREYASDPKDATAPLTRQASATSGTPWVPGAIGPLPTALPLARLLFEDARDFSPHLQRMAKEVLAALASDPASPRLQGNAAFLLRTLAEVDTEKADRLLVDLAGVVPLPGQAWPPLPVIHAAANVLGGYSRWAELLDTMRVWSRQPERLFLDPSTWSQHLQREGTLRAYAATARSWQEGWDILPAALTDLRRQTGGHYSELARLALGWARLPLAPSDEREALFKQAFLPPQAPPPMPAPFPAWQLEVKNPTDLDFLREASARRASLNQWLPTEWHLLPRPSLNQAWRLSLGEAASTGDEELPAPEALADRLLAGRPGRLWVASDRVGRAPESLGPLRLRISLLLQRMPCRDLEPMLAGDLSRSLLGAALSPDGLDESLWFTEARHAIPAIEEHLQRWPVDDERWGALAFWTAFVPAHRGPIELAEHMPSLRAGLPTQLCLPPAVHVRVTEQLQRRKAWVALRAWCEPAWEGLLSLGNSAEPGRTLLRDLGPVVAGPLEAAYAALGQTGLRRRLQEARRDLEGGTDRSRRP